MSGDTRLRAAAARLLTARLPSGYAASGSFLTSPVRKLALAGGLACLLGGCVESMPPIAAEAPAPMQRIAARPGVSPSGATIAFTSLDGPPASVANRFHAAMSSALASRDVATAPSGSAAYLVQGHLGAWPGEKGVTIAWVWDVFDARRHRLRRLEDEILISQSGDPWAPATDAVLASIAARSADELAAFLSNTPEAVAAVGQRGPTPAGARVGAAAPGTALGYAAVH